MELEKRYFGSWWVWIGLLVVASAIILTVLSYFGLIGQTIVERKVFEHSYQKRAADKDAVTTYDAQISILRRRLQASELTNQERSEIQAQIDALNILKASKEN